VHLNALKTFQKPVESPTYFLKALREPISLFKRCKGNQTNASTNRKKGIQKPREKAEYVQAI